jgi:two-component system, cell cycle sensor histidine kinase and response regulator CckA
VSRPRQVSDVESLFRRLVLGFGAVVLFLVGVGVAAGTTYVDQQIGADEDRIAAALARVVSTSVHRVSFSGRYHAQLLVEQYVEEDPVLVYLRIVQTDGEVYAESGPHPDPGSEVAQDGGFRVVQVDGAAVREVAVPFRGGFLNEQIGVIRIGVSRAHGAARLRRQLAGVLVFGVLVGVLALVFVVRASQAMAAPVQSLAGEFAGVLEYAPFAVCIQDRHGVVVRSSRRFEELFAEHSPTVGRRLVELLGDADSVPFLAEEGALLEPGAKALRSERTLTRGGSTRTFSVTRFPLTGDGQVGQICTMAQDVTETLALQDSLLQARRMESIGQFAGGVAHDFNNILTGVAGATDLIESADDRDQVLEQSGHLRSLTAMAADLTSRLLSFGRKQVTVVAPQDLHGILNDLQGFLRRVVREDVTLSLSLEPDEGLPVRVDRGQIDQVVLTLVGNARDAMAEGGHVTVATRVTVLESETAVGSDVLPAGRYASLEVVDEGGGIPEEIRDRLFDPFATTKGLGQGTGLGLSIVYGIVSRHGGAIDFTTGPDGTAFRILLPLLEASALSDQPQHATALRSRTSPLRLLLVEDNTFVRNSVVAALRRRGHEVWEAPDGPEGIEVFQASAEPFDVVLLDVVMPSMNGAEVADELRVLAPGTRILFMTGYDDDILRDVLEGEPTLAWIQKPFTLEALVLRLSELAAVERG